MHENMKSLQDSFVFQKAQTVTPLSELSPKVAEMVQPLVRLEPYKEPTAITLISKKKANVTSDKNGGHYFVGGLPALMQASRLLQNDPTARVTYVNDGQIKKSTQSAHQGHVHPTEWTTPELGTWQLTKLLLESAHILRAPAPEDVANYSYVHFPLSSIRIGLFLRNITFKFMRMLRAKNNISADDRWQCDAVRESLAFHKALSDDIVVNGGEPTFSSSWRLIWSASKEGIEKKRAIWADLGIPTEPITQEELRSQTLLKDTGTLYGLKVLHDGKFFANVDQKIINYLTKKYANFEARVAGLREVYLDENTPFQVLEEPHQLVAIDSLYGSLGHNRVFKEGSKKPLWNEVPVTGVSTLWVCSITKKELFERFKEMSDEALISKLKDFVGGANLTNLHTTIWDACVENDMIHLAVRATEGANFNSEYADPRDLANMTANINRFFIGSWKLILAGSCTRKTTTANVPEITSHFIHGLSGIGFSFSGASKEMILKNP
jgi:hypothetical protein